ncbi:hypothetical protein [Coleofasciculus chthonoplastes]|jgi:hypothetical protein|uniref:hypothetical protein n=1 Tax=Coleofasciculus TaxID=669368 RepID=UPI0032FBB649
MASALFNLLADLAQDPNKLQTFGSDPDSVLNEYDLTDEQKELIKQGGEDNFTRLLVDERARQFGDDTEVPCV